MLDLFNGQYLGIKVIILAELECLRVTVMPQFNFIVPCHAECIKY